MLNTVANGLLVPTDDFLVSPSSFGIQDGARFAALANGGFIATWHDETLGVEARFYDQDGNPVGTEFPVGDIVGREPSVTVLPNGNMVVSWSHENFPGDFDVYARMFDSSGAALGNAFMVNTYTGGTQTHSSVITLANGDFVVTWDVNYSFSDVRAQIYAADGSKIGGEIIATGSGPSYSGGSTIAALSGGGFVITWGDYADIINGAGDPGVRAQLFDASGAKVGGIIALNSVLPGVQGGAIASALPSGGFAAAWTDSQYSPNPAQDGVWLQLFDANGGRVGNEIHVTSGGAGGVRSPSIEVFPGTGVLVVWQQSDVQGAWIPHLEAQLFDFNGNALGAEFGLGANAAGTQGFQDLALLSGGQVIAGWVDTVTNPDDADFRAEMLFPLIVGTNGPDVITGGSHRDFISAGAGDDQITAGAGADLIDAGDGNDIVDGGADDDILTGGLGIDTLTGGTGNDIFQDTAAGLNGDTISDFSAGDRIVITDATLAGFTFNLTGNLLTYSGGSVTLSSVPSGSIIALAASGGGVQLEVSPLLATPGHAGDINGDGRDDILWRNDNGMLTDWLGTASGGYTANAANALSVVDPSWHVVGTGDFNGDHRDDVMWRNIDGRITNWLGTATGGFTDNVAHAYNAVSIDWQVAGIGDFNGDHRADILWHNIDGRVTDWLSTLSGGYAPNSGAFYTSISTDWQIVGVGDFNGDNRDDIMWRNVDGRITNWLGTANGGFSDNVANAYNAVSLDWQVAGIGDFNGDNRDDILWRNGDGRVTEWLSTASGGYAPNSANFYTIISTDWQVASISDINGDTRDDILWRNDDGRITNWLGTANGSFTDNLANGYTAVDTHWHVQPHSSLV